MEDKLEPPGVGLIELELSLEEVIMHIIYIDFGDNTTCFPYTMEKCAHHVTSTLPNCSDVQQGISAK
jgi:hypothetical protein